MVNTAVRVTDQPVAVWSVSHHDCSGLITRIKTNQESSCNNWTVVTGKYAGRRPVFATRLYMQGGSFYLAIRSVHPVCYDDEILWTDLLT